MMSDATVRGEHYDSTINAMGPEVAAGETEVLPSYDEALNMTRISSGAPSTPVQHQPPVHSSSRNAVHPVTQSGSAVVSYHAGRRESQEEVHLSPGLTSPEPPRYESSSETVLEPPSAGPRPTAGNFSFTPLHLHEPISFCCYAGVGSLRMPNDMITAWRVGSKRIMSIGSIGNWPRYTFLAVQCLLLLAGITMSFVVPFDSDFQRYLRIGFLVFALTVNFIERFLFWCVHALSDLRDDGTWNFRADFIRLFFTEILIYGGLMTALGSPLNGSVNRYSIVGLIALLYFLTSVVMKMFIVTKITWSLLKRKVANHSNAATSQKYFLYGLCINTGALIALQEALVVFIGFYFNDDSLFPLYSPIPFTVCSGLVPLFLWGLYFWGIAPMARLFPISMALDLPHTRSCPEQINTQAILPQFNRMHTHSKTCGGFAVNLHRLYSSPLFALAHLLYGAAWGYMVTFLLITDGSTLMLTVSRYVALSLLLILSLPAVICALFVPAFTPMSLAMTSNHLRYNQEHYWSITSSTL